VNQKHYEALGDVIVDYIFEQLETRYNMDKILVPLDSDNADGEKSFIYVSKDLGTNADRCCVMIHGAGAVRAGMWARSVCINESLNTGTVFPFVEAAYANGYSVVIANPNLNYAGELGKPSRKQIPLNGSPEAHCRYLWTRFLRSCPAA
jgi:hypothetical protein